MGVSRKNRLHKKWKWQEEGRGCVRCAMGNWDWDGMGGGWGVVGEEDRSDPTVCRNVEILLNRCDPAS